MAFSAFSTPSIFISVSPLKGGWHNQIKFYYKELIIMKIFKLFDESKLKKNEKIDEVITNWLNEKIPQTIKIIHINQSTDLDGYLLISIYYSL